MPDKGIEEICIDDLSFFYDTKVNTVDDLLRLADIKNRRLFLDGSVESFASQVVSYIIKYNAEDIGLPIEKRKPIVLYVSSEGGDMESGLNLVNMIASSKTPVYTINMGYAYSMAIYIMMAGHKRYAMPGARFLLHDGETRIAGSMNKTHDVMNFQKNLEENLKQFVLSKTKITDEEYTKNSRIEWFMLIRQFLKSRDLIWIR